MYLLGYDLGSSFIKASLLDVQSGLVIASSQVPQKEMEIAAKRPGWAEQSPEVWWSHIKSVTGKILAEKSVNSQEICAIGISYQMHGLVLVDRKLKAIRDAIIWCDSRAVEIGAKAYDDLGNKFCNTHFLNSPGNFTASKLKWVKDHQPQIFSRVYKMMLPGDYIAMRMTGKVNTTKQGLSEAILWDYHTQGLATDILDYYGIPHDVIPDLVPVFSIQGRLTAHAADELGLRKGTLICYRAGDQPNNAFSLNVLQPGEVAATAGTSGVVYGVSDQKKNEKKSRVNTFLHVNHTQADPRYGVLLCVNGAGMLYSWLRKYLLSVGEKPSYDSMNTIAEKAPIGSSGVVVLPFGNGAERMLADTDIGCSIHNLRFNTHTTSHMVRAAQEGIVFSLKYGLDIMKKVGVKGRKIKAGYANMFLSPLFRQAFATATGVNLEMYNTDGASGAARGAGYGSGVYKRLKDAYVGLKAVETIRPVKSHMHQYKKAYDRWLHYLDDELQKLSHRSV